MKGKQEERQRLLGQGHKALPRRPLGSPKSFFFLRQLWEVGAIASRFLQRRMRREKDVPGYRALKRSCGAGAQAPLIPKT